LLTPLSSRVLNQAFLLAGVAAAAVVVAAVARIVRAKLDAISVDDD
jgi:hypothetical protein